MYGCLSYSNCLVHFCHDSSCVCVCETSGGVGEWEAMGGLSVDSILLQYPNDVWFTSFYHIFSLCLSSTHSHRFARPLFHSLTHLFRDSFLSRVQHVLFIFVIECNSICLFCVAAVSVCFFFIGPSSAICTRRILSHVFLHSSLRHISIAFK